MSLVGLRYEDCKHSYMEVKESSFTQLDVGDADLEIENVPPSCSEKLSKCCGHGITLVPDKPPSIVCSEEIAKNCDAFFQGITKKCDACTPAKHLTSMEGYAGGCCHRSSEKACSTLDKEIQDFGTENKLWYSSKQNLDWITSCQNVQLDVNSRMNVNETFEKYLGSSHSSSNVKKKERESCYCCDSSTRPPLLCEKRDSDFSKPTEISSLKLPVTSECSFADCELVSRDTSSSLQFYDKDFMANEFRLNCADLCLSTDSSSDLSSYCRGEHSGEDSAMHDQAFSSSEEDEKEEDKEVDNVFQFVPPLEFLSLNGCNQISDQGLM